MEHYEKNVRLYPLHRLFFGLLIIGPVLTPYLRLKGLDYAAIMLLQSISALALVVFELPTGVVADRFSRKLSIVLSCVCIALALTVYILSKSFALLAIAEILFALGITFRSGADSAFLYESLAKLGRSGDYARVEGQASSYVFIGQGVGTLFCSLLYAVHPDIPFWVSVGSAVVAGLVALAFTEPERARSEGAYHRHIAESLRLIRVTPGLSWGVLLAVLMGFSFRSAYWLYEPYFNRVEVDIVYFGAIFSGFNLVAALAAKYLSQRWIDQRRVLLALGLLHAFTYLLPALWVSVAAIGVIALQQIVRGVYKPTLGAYINARVGDAKRATMHSLLGMAAALCFALFSPFVGISLDAGGAISTYLWMGVVTLLGTFVLALWRR